MSEESEEENLLKSVIADFHSGNLDAATTGIKGLTDRNPDSPDCWMWKGLILEKSGQDISALEAYGKALSISPENPWLYYHRGHLHRKLGLLEKALEDFEEVVFQNDDWEPHLYEVLMSSARIYIGLGDYQQAQRCFDSYGAYSGKKYVSGHGAEAQDRRKAYEKIWGKLNRRSFRINPGGLFILYEYASDLLGARELSAFPEPLRKIWILGDAMNDWQHGAIHFLVSHSADRIPEIRDFLKEIGASKGARRLTQLAGEFPPEVEIYDFDARRNWIWKGEGKERAPQLSRLGSKLIACKAKICRKALAYAAENAETLRPPELVSW